MLKSRLELLNEFKRKKILLVDDDSDLRKIARHILESAGMIVDEAESVAQGTEQIKNSPPHVLLTDLHMPVETGFDLIEKLRALWTVKETASDCFEFLK